MRAALRSGLSLPEMLLAVALFATAFLAVIGTFPALGRAVARARAITLATQVAEGVLEEQRALGNSSVPATGNVTVANQGTFYYTLQVTPLPLPSPTFRDLQVEVVWYEQDGELHRVRLETEVGP